MGTGDAVRRTDSFDVVVSGGTILDGEGTDPCAADIGITGDRIAAVGDLGACHAGLAVDATGLRISPGFIDIHTHSDISVTFNGQMASMVSQGVTTQVVGNCALCLGMALDAPDFAFERRWLGAHGSRITWDSLDGHLRRVEDDGVATNYVMLAGHGTIRKRVIGLVDRTADQTEIARMQALLAAAMDQGAWGLSSGLEYAPSSYADVGELAALSSVVAPYGGVYATHLRNEGDRLLEAVAEAIEVGESAGVRVQLSHHKAEGRQNWGKVHETIAMIEAARDRGVDICMDQYPYTAFMTNMSVQFLPTWANSGDNDAVLARLADPETRRRVRADMLAAHPDWDDRGEASPWRRVEVGVARGNRALQGRRISDLAAESGQSPVDIVIDLIVHEQNFISAINDCISEDDIARVMRHPLTMVGSDAVGTAPVGKLAEDRVHPRCYGTFPRVLGRYVRAGGTVSEAEAVRKMTSMPADRLGIRDRGRIRAGAFADLVLYDPRIVGDTATFADPHRFSIGIDTVLVNGRTVWSGGAVTGALPGRALRRGA